jgi:hypothetical protein
MVRFWFVQRHPSGWHLRFRIECKERTVLQRRKESGVTQPKKDSAARFQEACAVVPFSALRVSL